MTSRSQITTSPDWLDNELAGQMLIAKFLEPEVFSIARLAEKIGLSPERIAAVIDGACPMGAELDLRLGRYSGMSEGFFLRLQNQFELLEAKRALNGELNRIVPRAA